jgi:serine/threonine-protein kinase
MGEVYKARDRRLGRTVALKFILGSDPELVMRFLQEARAQARIDHPNICKVYEVGEVQGKAYIAMQFVEGQRLDRAAATMTQAEKVRVIQEVAVAIHEAHRQGVIHRDLKPTNIVVERSESGRYFPVVMDFGLAYDASHGHGLTLSGALLGTPSYMAPEQARGDLANIDRRSDVYSLGATLYELLVGTAPFTDPTLAGTLDKVLNAEPPSLHSRMPQIERDLEIIVLKCLSKEPHQRYPSARALAEDLARFLDGEAIIGQRPSLPYRLRRIARKHRALVAVSALSLATILVLATFGVRAWLEARRTQQQSEERARLAERLGQEVKEIEWFLRLAYALPLHDTGREQQLVRERMQRIAVLQPGLGATGEGLVHYALGRGHLALHELDKAHEELLRARRLGLDSPELHYALGRVLGELYHRALEHARRSGDKDWLAARQRELEQQYLQPALQSLERSQGVELESPRYLEGLIAFYRRQYDVALRAAAQASAEAPWMHEAWKLAGDVTRVQAMEQFGVSYEAAGAGLLEAASLYENAIALGGSAPVNYEALAEVWLRRSELDEKQGRSQEQALERALAASEKSIQAAPLRSVGYTQKAYVLMRRFWGAVHQPKGQDVRALLEEWIATARRAVELDPQDVSAYDALGIAYLKYGGYEGRNGRDPIPWFREASAQLSRALELQPNHPWALNDLGTVFLAQGRYQRETGQDPRASYQEAIRRFEQAAKADPKYLFPLANQTTAYSELAAYSTLRGLSPESEVQKALQAAERGLAVDPSYYWTMNSAAAAELALAGYLLQADQDPRPALDGAHRHLERSLSINPAHARTHLYQAMRFCLEATRLLKERRDPSTALGLGRQAVERALGYDGKCAECRIESARLSLVEAAWEQQRGRSGATLLQRALTDAQRAVELFPTFYETYLELARVHWRLAETAAPGAARASVAEGLKQVEQALQIDPALAQAYALRGALLLVQAQRTGEAAGRRELLLQARAALARAVDLNPRVRGEYEALLQEAQEPLAQESP